MALIPHVLVGTPEEIRAGKGRTAITITQAAGRLGVSELSVRNLIAKGALASVARFAGALLFLEQEVEQLRIARER